MRTPAAVPKLEKKTLNREGREGFAKDAEKARNKEASQTRDLCVAQNGIRKVASRLMRRKERGAARWLPQVLRETKSVSLRMTTSLDRYGNLHTNNAD